jgi:hypothetical protein
MKPVVHAIKTALSGFKKDSRIRLNKTFFREVTDLGGTN